MKARAIPRSLVILTSIFFLLLSVFFTLVFGGELRPSHPEVPPGHGWSEDAKNSPGLESFSKLDGLLSTFLYDSRPEARKLLKALINLSEEDSLISILIFAEAPSSLGAIPGLSIRTVLGNVITGTASRSAVRTLLSTEGVVRIEFPRVVKPLLDISVPEIKVPLVWGGNPSYKGSNIVVGVYDTGIDLTHADFQNLQGKSRILYLWDQTAGSGTAPQGYGYGAEYTKARIDSGTCPERDINGHGTHVAGIAGGDGSSSGSGYIGVAPLSDLIIVKGGDGTFETDKVLDGINYISQKARALGKPAVINLSLGGHYGSHDGKRLDELGIDAASGESLIVVAAAGNEGDLRIHAGGSLTQGQPLTRTFAIPTYTPNSGAANDYCILGIWYQGGNSVNFTLTDPLGGAHGPVATGNSLLESTQSGYLDLKNGVGGVNPLNGLREIEVTIYDASSLLPPRAGTWTITLSGDAGAFDGWVYMSCLGNYCDLAEFTQASWDSQKQVSMPGTARKTITVGAYTTKVCWPDPGGPYCFDPAPIVGDIAVFSSQGPTRDGREKPEISAPGLLITSSRSSDASYDPQLNDPDGKHTGLYGTSMAAPHITGVVALMLEKYGALMPEDVKYHLTTTARTDPYTGSVWNKFWGYGKVDAEAAVQSVTPVELSDFTGTPLDGGILITWKTTLSSDIALFYLHRESEGNERKMIYEKVQSGEMEVSFLDTKVLPGVSYSYWLEIIERSGEERSYGPIYVKNRSKEASEPLKVTFVNPSRYSVHMTVDSSMEQRLQIQVFTVSGKLVCSVFDGKVGAGESEFVWNGRDRSGKALPSGLYLVKVSSPHSEIMKKVVFFK